MSDPRQESDWLLWSIDAFGLWFRKWGQYSLVGIVFGLFTHLIDNMPPVGSQVLLFGGIIVGLIAIVRMLSYFQLGRTGRRINGHVKRIDKRRTPFVGRRHAGTQYRIAYSYEVDGTPYDRETDWVGKKAFSKLQTGDRIDVLVDQDDPVNAQPAILVPSTNPDFFEP